MIMCLQRWLRSIPHILVHQSDWKTLVKGNQSTGKRQMTAPREEEASQLYSAACTMPDSDARKGKILLFVTGCSYKQTTVARINRMYFVRATTSKRNSLTASAESIENAKEKLTKTFIHINNSVSLVRAWWIRRCMCIGWFRTHQETHTSLVKSTSRMGMRGDRYLYGTELSRNPNCRMINKKFIPKEKPKK